MKKTKLFAIFLSLTIAICGFWVFRGEITDFYLKILVRLPRIEKDIQFLVENEVGKQIFTPPPLQSSQENPQAILTKEGVMRWTNIQRAKFGLPPLKENSVLSETAVIKVDDMFKNQYFAHESSSGISVDGLVKRAGYNYIAIGENLASGSFENDEKLVQAWMDSPGHRANILNTRYVEIGVSVKKGIYEGKTTWLAVQHFGMPLSACSQPDTFLKMQIDNNQIQLDEMKSTLDRLALELENMRPKRGVEYNQKVEQYNSLAVEYNDLAEATKKLVIQYNSQVNSFNQCAISP